MKKSGVIVLSLIFVALFISFVSSEVYGAIYYVDDDGPWGSGTSEYPYRYIQDGIGQLIAGDTLIIRDGTYSGEYNNVPIMHTTVDGTSDAWINITAENDFGVIIDGIDLVNTSLINNILLESDYTSLEGIISLNAPSTGIVVKDSEYVKVMRCGSGDSNRGLGQHGSAISVAQSNYTLIEGCFVWGEARYQIRINSPAGGDSTIPDSHFNVFRANVARYDFGETDEPKGSFASYTQDHTYFFNNIALDGEAWTVWENLVEERPNTYCDSVIPSGIFTPKGYVDSEIRGNIVLNFEGWGLHPAGDHSPDGMVIKNNVVWDLKQGHSMFDYDCLGSSVLLFKTDQASDDTEKWYIGHNTFGNSKASSGVKHSQGILMSVTDSILYNLSLDPGQGTIRGFHSDYNVFYGNEQDYSDNGNRGANDWSDQESSNPPAINPLDNGLSSIVKIDDGSYLDGSASDGGDRGATVLKQIGCSGCLYGDEGWNETQEGIDLWPWKNQDVIEQYLCSWSKDITYFGNVVTLNGNRGFCHSENLTDYILNYLNPDLQTCSELGGNICGGDQSCDGTSIPSSDGSCCIGTCMDCSISNAVWSSTEVVEGTQVNLDVQGDWCDGKTLEFDIREDDNIFTNWDGADQVVLNSLPENAIFSNGVASSSWITEWYEDTDGIDNDPEYIFNASLVSYGSVSRISDNELKVLQDTTPPVISNVNVNSFANSALITWDTDKNSDSTVNYGLTTAYGNSEYDSSLVTSHTISLTNLQSETTYYYEIISCTSGGYCSETYEGSFTTPVVSDIILDHNYIEADTSLKSDNNHQEDNYGNLNYLYLDGNGGTSMSYVLMEWNVDSIIGQDVDQAILYMYTRGMTWGGSDSSIIRIYPLARNDWEEMQANFYRYRDGFDWAGYDNNPPQTHYTLISPDDYSSSHVYEGTYTEIDEAWYQFDITPLVQGWSTGQYDRDAGFVMIIEDIERTVYQFISSDSSDVSLRPRIEVSIAGSQGCQNDGDCNDQNACTVDSCNIGTGVCEYSNLDCNDGMECSIDSCNVNTGCEYDYSNCNDELIYLDSGQWSDHEDVAVAGNIVYATMAYGVQAWNTQDPANLILSGDLYVEDEGDFYDIQPYKLDVLDDLLVFSTDEAGRLYLVNIANPSNMYFYNNYISEVGRDADVQFVDVNGDKILFSADRDNHFYAFNVNNPNSPVVLDSIDFSNGMSGLTILGDRAIVSINNIGIGVIDITNPSSLSLVTTLQFPNPYNTGYKRNVHANGNYAVMEDDTNGFYVIDITNIDNPSFVQQVIPKIGSNPGNGELRVRDVFVNGNILYLVAEDNDLVSGNREGGVAVYYLDNINPDGSPYSYGPHGGFADVEYMDVDLTRGLLYFTQWADVGIPIHDISNIDNIQYEGGAVAYDYCRHVDYDSVNKLVYCITGHNGVIAHSHDDPYNLIKRGTVDWIGDSMWNGASGVQVVGDYVFATATDDGLVILDFSDPDNPQEISRVPELEDKLAQKVLVVNDVAYVPAYKNGLYSVDVSNVNGPGVLDQISNTPEYGMTRLSINGNLLATSEYNPDLPYSDCRDACYSFFKIWDIQDPSNIQLLSSYEFLSRIIDVDFYGNYLLVTISSDGTYAFDVSNPSGPVNLGKVNTGSDSCDYDCRGAVTVNGNILVVAKEDNGISIYDLSTNLLNPAELDSYDTADRAYNAIKKGDRVYVADHWGLTALQFGSGSQCQLTNAYWQTDINDDTVDDNTLVTLTVVGNDCNGEQINFTIYEDDPIFDDLVTSQIDTYGTATWTATWTYPGDDDIGSDPRDYYFEATLVSNESVTYASVDQLHVQEAIVCQDGDGDGYGVCPNCNITNGCQYDGDDCDDSLSQCGAGCNPGQTEICDDSSGYDEDCDGLANENDPECVSECIDNDGDGYDNCNIGEQGDDGLEIDCDDDPSQCGSDCYPGNTEMCDGYDNDCNIVTEDGVDEIWYGQSTTCGIGECSSTGNLICQDGNQIDTCQEGTPVNETCDNLDNDCDGTPDNGGDALCDNDLWCDGIETCGGILGCQAGTPPITDDGIDCTDDSCDENDDIIIHTTNDGFCDDELWCTGEDYCDALLDCQIQNIPDCNDGVSCTVDSCNETSNSCDFVIDDLSCLINGTCYSDGENNSAYECQECNTSNSQDSWDNSICECSVEDDYCPDDGNLCTLEYCDTGSGFCSYLNEEDGVGCQDGVIGEWSSDYCKDEDVYHNRTITNYDCSLGECLGTNIVEEVLVEDCLDTCQDGQCIIIIDEFNLILQQGVWNYISVPLEMQDSSVEQLEADLLLTYDSTTDSWQMNMGPFVQITELEPLRGYIAQASEDKQINFTGTSIGDYPLINDAWNLVGVNRTGTVAEIYGAGEFRVFYWNGGGIVELPLDSELQPGIAYWIGVGDVESPPEEKSSGGATSKLIRGLVRIFGFLTYDLTDLPVGNLLLEWN